MVSVQNNKDGKYCQDPAGIWHYKYSLTGGTVLDMAKVALDGDVPLGPKFLWFNGYFCPIVHDDTPETLADRMSSWFMKGNESMITSFQEFTGNYNPNPYAK